MTATKTVSSARGPRRVSPARIWVATINNYTEENVVDLLVLLKELDAEFVVAREVAASGTRHLQCAFRRSVKWRPLPALAGFGAHFERGRGAWWQAVMYCLKDGDWLSSYDDPWSLCYAHMNLAELEARVADMARAAAAAIHAHWVREGRPVRDVSWGVREFREWARAHEVLATRVT